MGAILMGLMGLLLAGMVTVNVLVPPPVPPTVETESAAALVGAIVGQVELRKQGTKSWQPIALGGALTEGDEVRTGLFSEAVLHLRGASSVTVSPNTAFVVGQEQIELSSFELGEGRITAAIPKSAGREFEFRSRGSEAIASVEKGEFSLATDGKGTVVVDTSTGEVKVRAKGKVVQVKKGHRSVVLPDKPPTEALPVPSSVALQVRWPATKSVKTRTRVSGSTTAAATVMVNGILVRADPQGQFSLDVALQQGKNRVVVIATDASGRTTVKQSPEIRVDSSPPDLKVDAEGLWK